MITIDGNYMEGGGQLVRTALALSTFCGCPFAVDSIRLGRKNPGLKAQHLHGVRALEGLCGASTTGAQLGSTALEYSPGPLEGRTLSVDIGTAGAVTLLMQALFLPCLFADSKVRLKIKGGTDTRWSMPVDYMTRVLLPHLERFGDIDVRVLRRGYYPKGGGKVDITIVPKIHRRDDPSPDAFLSRLRSRVGRIELIGRGPLLEIGGMSHAAADLRRSRVAERQARAAANVLKQMIAGGAIGAAGAKVKVNIAHEYCDTESFGSGITLWAVFRHTRLGADALGEKGKRAEIVGEEAARALVTEIQSGAVVDRCLCDNLVPFLALVGGDIRTSEVTDHTLSNIYVTEKFLPARFRTTNDSITVA